MANNVTTFYALSGDKKAVKSLYKILKNASKKIIRLTKRFFKREVCKLIHHCSSKRGSKSFVCYKNS